MMIVVTGASSSGKSRFAEQCLMDRGGLRRLYLATMIPWDEECLERIAKHRKMRAEKQFVTVECPVDVQKAEGIEGSAVLLECMSNLAANELYREDMEQPQVGAEERIFKGILEIKKKAADLVVVTNEVFSDGETYSEETERYRKVLGNLNCRLAAEADLVYEVVCGIPLVVKGPGGKTENEV